LAQRTLEKAIKIVDEEMQGVGGQKITMPKLLAADLWKLTGRWSTTGEEVCHAVRSTVRKSHLLAS